MLSIKNAIKKFPLALSIVLLLFVYPAPAFAAGETGADPASSTTTTTPSPTTTTPSSDSTTTTNTQAPATDSSPPKPATGPAKPTGADANKYTYNAATGLWENDKYTWNPNTNQTQPKTPQSYSYNPTTGMWDTTQWQYNPATGTYVPNTVSVSQNPNGSTDTQSSTGQPLANSSIQSTGPDSNNTVNNSSNTNHTFDLFYNASISNTITSVAHSGDAVANFNTSVGDVTSGAATDMATIMNLLQSSSGFQGGNYATFTDNIMGNVQGDLYIDPAQLAKVQTGTNPENVANNLTINAQNNGAINNNIALDATSGNATASSNTQAGNVTSGTANAVANVVNMINSAIGSGQSFLGAINVYGNLNGDILLPPDVLNNLLASNIPTTQINTSQLENSQVLANVTNNQTINNNVQANATTGKVDASQNTMVGGNDHSGNAGTNLTVLNLTGQQVIGKNALLVFVNVLGKWVGMIMNAPAGATAAELGGGITQNTLAAQNVNANVTNNQTINNNLKLNAASGDATATKNTKVGNVNSGNATASANLVNILNSNLSLSNWFGILFINVFGTWNGSFGINTAAGNPILPPTGSASAGSGASGIHDVKVFRFVPTSGGNSFRLTSVPTNNFYQPTGGSGSATQARDAVLASSQTTPPHRPAGAKVAATSHYNWLIPAVGSIVGAGLLGSERLVSERERRQKLAATPKTA